MPAARQSTSGIPGRGELRDEEIRQWLGKPENHQPLNLRLPVGLDYLPNRLDKIPTVMTRAKIELGRQLFLDIRLSLDHMTSCASCHDPDHGYTIPHQFGTGVGGQKGTRNPPTLINRVMFAGIGEEEFWDGHAASLEDAVLISITDPTGMANTLDRVIKTLRNTPGYSLQFNKIYGGATIAGLGDAVAAFIRVIVTSASDLRQASGARLDELDQCQAESTLLVRSVSEAKASEVRKPASTEISLRW